MGICSTKLKNKLISKISKVYLLRLAFTKTLLFIAYTQHMLFLLLSYQFFTFTDLALFVNEGDLIWTCD